MGLLAVVRDVGVRDKSNNHSTIVWRTLYLFEPSPLDLSPLLEEEAPASLMARRIMSTKLDDLCATCRPHGRHDYR